MRKNKVYKSVLIEALQDLSSIEFQKVAWFENNQGLSSSFADDVSAVFEGSALEHALKQNGIVFDKGTDAALTALNDAVEAIGYNHNDSELIDSLEMQVVRNVAARCLALVQASDGSESTVEIIE